MSSIEQQQIESAKETKVESMSFLEHIEELRKRLVISFIGVIVCCGGVAFFISDLMNNIFLKPAFDAGLALQNLQPFGQPFLYFKVVVASGIILSMPFVLHQFWLFIAPALYENEKKWISLATLFTSLCFVSGVLFSFWVLIPSMLQFAANFGSEIIENKIDVNAYFGFVSMILLATGSVFELPVLSFILSRMELITPRMLTKHTRHAVVIILILAAVLTPTPDPISQLIFAAPIFILYELSILISWLVYKKKKTENPIPIT